MMSLNMPSPRAESDQGLLTAIFQLPPSPCLLSHHLFDSSGSLALPLLPLLTLRPQTPCIPSACDTEMTAREMRAGGFDGRDRKV